MTDDESTIAAKDRKFLLILVTVSVLLAALPYLIGLFSTPPDGEYLGYQYNTDDHMVYSAWMRQAMDGRFLMDNRFTADQQPSLTINVYFFVLGLLAKVAGLSLAATIGRLFFSGLFVVLLYRLVRRLGWEPTRARLAMVLTVVGGGIGFVVWHSFGVDIVRSTSPPLNGLLGGHLPTDVWQPEGFVFPSMLTNGLFMVSLCLFICAAQSILDARESWWPVVPGALALCLLMNIHSYDVLIMALVMVGFLAATIAQRAVTVQWLLRAAVIGAGALPSALWFVHVLKLDPVFQARANTDTPSADFRAVLFGYILLIVPALAGLIVRPVKDLGVRQKRTFAVAVVVLLFIGMFIAAGSNKSQYFLDASGWALVTLIAVGATYLLTDENPAMNLIISWALVGTVAMYFPGLFQRKLAMGLSIPWAILAGYGFADLIEKQASSTRRLMRVLVTILIGATSVRWLARELVYIRTNTSRTSVQTVFLDSDTDQIIDYLDRQKGRLVVIAPPGVPSAAFDKHGDQESGQYATTPMVPDLNPVVSGLTGAYTYAGHWSETPDYEKRRALLQAIYYGKLDPEQRRPP